MLIHGKKRKVHPEFKGEVPEVWIELALADNRIEMTWLDAQKEPKVRLRTWQHPHGEDVQVLKDVLKLTRKAIELAEAGPDVIDWAPVRGRPDELEPLIEKLNRGTKRAHDLADEKLKWDGGSVALWYGTERWEDVPRKHQEILYAEYVTRLGSGFCVFCRREGIDPPAAGSYATGSYRPMSTDVQRPQPFRGYVCEMHADTVDWLSIQWA